MKGYHKKKAIRFRLLLLRMFNTTFVGTGVLDCPQQKNFGRDIVFSADLCYNGANRKPPSEREGDRVSGGRSLRDFRFALTSL